MMSILIPVFTHILWCFVLYASLTITRAPAVWGIGSKPDGSNPLQSIEIKISANLSNQFEWPVFFHLLCAILYTTQSSVSDTLLGLAWLFIAGRILHSLVQIFCASIRLRGMVFTINFLAVLAMWIVFSIEIFRI